MTCARYAAGNTEAPFAAFGVFDGHGGKFAAAHAAKQLLGRVMAAVDRGVPAPSQPSPPEAPLGGTPPEGTGSDPPGGSSKVAPQGAGLAGGPPEAEGVAADAAVPEGASARVRALWRLQDELLERLPQVGTPSFSFCVYLDPRRRM